MNSRYSFFARVGLLAVLVAQYLQPQFNVFAAAALTITPITWNIIGLDSNNVNVGPNHFPVGARVCNTGDAIANNLSATLNWDSANSYIDIRPGTNSTLTLASLAAGTCADFYFEVEVDRDSNAYDTTRNYHITVTANGGLTASTPTPRTLYVEHLISQNRNSVSDVQFGTSLASLTSVGAGGTMTLMVGNTYYIRLVGFTATQGYEQIESFINFPNTIFQVLSVDATYTAESSATLMPPYDKLYGDACTWENDPSSPNYRACLSTGKAGGDITVTYRVKILQVPSAPLVNPEPLSTLIYDFSGSSFHYNSDYGVSTRFAMIVNANIIKSFTPKTINPGGTSTLTFTINNPGVETLTNVNFTDSLPAGVTISSATVNYSGCGVPSPASLTVGATSLSFSNITIGSLSKCTVGVSVTSSTNGTHNNTSGNLFINTSVDTGSFATDSLVVSSTPSPPASCTTRATMATWTLENQTASTSTNNGPFSASSQSGDVATATASHTVINGSASGIANTVTFPTGWSAPASTGNSGNSWGVRGGWLSSSPADPTTASTPYFQFQVDASQYGGIGVTASYNLQGNWSNSGNWYVLFSTDGTTWSSAGTGAWDKSNAWQSNGITATTTSTGNSTVYFRVFAAGAQYSGSPSSTTGTLYLDGIQITGCQLPAVPTLSKSFSPTSIPQGSASTLTFTLNNPNATSALSGVAFSDTLPEGLTVASASTSACSGGTLTTTAPRTISLTGGSLAASGTCTINVTVTGVVAGSHTNISGNISSTETGSNTTSNGYGTSSLIVVAPPAIAKSFTANPIFTGNSTTLSFSITNPNTSTALTGISFTDTLPAGLDVANGSSPQCGGTLTTANNAPAQDTVSLSGGSLAAAGSCSFSVSVIGSTAGLKANSVTVSSTNGGTGNTSTANVLVKDPVPVINLLKQVGPGNSGPWTPSLTVTPPANVYYRFTVENVGDVALTSVNVTDPSLISPSPASCLWVDGDGTPLTAPFNLPVADANDNQLAVCVLGPFTAVVGTNPNTATASGTYNTTTVSDSSTATYTGLGVDLNVTKTNDVSGIVAPSGTFTWTITVANSGTNDAVFANGQTIISDPLPAGPTYGAPSAGNFTNVTNSGNVNCSVSAGTLSCTASGANVTIGASGSFTVSFTVTPSTAGSLANTATVDPGGNVNESNEGNNTGADTVNVIAPPSISKNFSPDPILVNGTSILTFTITNSNTGTALTGVGFTDPLPAGLQVASPSNASTASCGSPTFAPSAADTTLTFSGGTIAASGTCTVSVDVTATTSGVKNNTTGNVTSTNGGTGNTASDALTVDAPAFTITKSPDVASVNAAGNIITYTVTFTNTGTSILTGVSVSDPLLTDLDCDGTPGAPYTTTGFTVNASASLTCSGTYAVTQADIDNNGGGDGDIDNTVTGDSNETGAQTANAAVSIVQNPAHTTTKTETSTGPYVVGNTITYNIVVTNTGNVTLTGVTGSDNNATVGTCAPAQPSTLAPNAAMTCSASHVVTQSDVDNGSFVNIATGDSDQTSPNTGTVTVNFAQSPSLNIVKEVATASTGPWDDTSVSVTVGDTVYYRIRVANTGNITLTGLTVDDGMAGCTLTRGTDLTGDNDNSFEVGEEWAYTCSVNAVAGTNNNTASADSNETGQDTDNASYTATVIPAPSMNVTKDGSLDMTVIAPNSRADAGDIINYTVSVQNTGNTTLTGVSVSDPLLSDLDCDGTPGAPFTTSGLTVNVGATLTCTDSYTIAQSDLDTNGNNNDGDIDNTATATSNETSPDSDPNEASLPLVPGIDVTKALNSSTFNNPNVVRLTYTITVQNTGNVTLSNLQVTDDLNAAFPGAVSFSVVSVTSADFNLNPSYNGGTDVNLLDGTDTLAVGSSGSITLVVDVDTGGDEDTYVNTATGFGDSPDGSTVQDDGVAGAPSFVDPALAKVANPLQASVGDTVTFTITVTNEGNVPAPDVVVTDTLPAMFDVTAVNVTGAPAGTTTTVNPPIGVGPAPYTVTVTIGGVGGTLGVNDVVVIQIVTTVNSLGNPPIVNNASLTTASLTDNVLNNADSVTITMLSPSSGSASLPALPATGFAPDVISSLPVQPEELKYLATDIWLEIPALGVKMSVVGVPLKKEGWDVSWLGNQAGWLEGSAFPSWSGNSVLTGHVTSANGRAGPFANLSQLKFGDKVIIHAYEQSYIFEVRSNDVVSANDRSAFKHEEKSWLTLVTCKEYDAKSQTYQSRVVVRAVLIEVK